MYRSERILAFLKTHRDTIQEGISAQTLSEKMKIHRSDASFELNKLFRQGILIKKGTRPVLYHFSDMPSDESMVEDIAVAGAQTEDAFSLIIGSDGSIKAQIELAKAAVSYPPHGLHTLIYGESGVGKNLMAESMWAFAQAHWSADGPIPFVQFNCADYAANEQLLLAQLFGYTKGAFTGANADREGIVDRAQGGILFLDEIHRLPATGQELLFMLIDKGTYRRLGETTSTRQANVMIIGATSEDITSNLLVTFLRRIPVQIGLPTIRERPLQERVKIILHSIWQEAKRLNSPIQVAGKVLDVFSSYPCMANIGGLKNDILLCCAKCYLESTASPARVLHLSLRHIPERILSFAATQAPMDERLQKLFHEGIRIEPTRSPLALQAGLPTGFHLNLYQYVDRKFASYRQQGVDAKKIAGYVGQDLEEYFSSVAQILHKAAEPIPKSLIDEAIWHMVKELLEKASHALNRRYNPNTITALAWHLQQFKERTLAGQTIFNPNLASIQAQHQEEYHFLTQQRLQLEQALGLPLPEDELGFLSIFLVRISKGDHAAHIGLIVVAHGRGTAFHMASVANQLLGTNCVRAYDIPLNRSNRQTLQELGRLIQETNRGKGVVLLVDMGFLMTMEESLCRQTEIPVRILPNVTTALILESGHQLFLPYSDIDEYVQSVNSAYQEYIATTRRSSADTTLMQKPLEEKKNILLLCPRSEDAAMRLKSLVLSAIPELRYAHFVVRDIQTAKEKLSPEYCRTFNLVIGTSSLEIEQVPFFPASALFDETILQKMIAQLHESIASKNSYTAAEEVPHIFSQLASQIGKFLKTLPAEPVSNYCFIAVQRISDDFFHGELSSDGIVRTYLHIACMLDRIYAGEPLNVPNWGAKLQESRKKDFQQLREIFSSIKSELAREIPLGELCYFVSSLPCPEEREAIHARKNHCM